ncbi:MAG: flagellar basal body P-ring protein FlgI [Sedimentisphaerales bacterium]|nr:flagellar basal body P-ring protein FlgI [Sedimentisphaerales bacterium]
MKTNPDNPVHTRLRIRITALFMVILLSTSPVWSLTRVRDIARPLGERSNELWNWGLVVGLNGTGDGGDVLIKARALMTWLENMNNPPGSLDELKSAKNVAIVSLSVELPRNGARNGDQLDVKVASFGNASSLAGGILLMTPLRSNHPLDDTIWAWAQGEVSIPDPDNPTMGIVKNGADMEFDIKHDYTAVDANNRVYFDLVLDEEQANWQTANAIAMFIDEMNTVPEAFEDESLVDAALMTQRTAEALDPRTVRIYIPDKQARNPASFISRIMSMAVELPDPEAVIVIHEKTGTIAFSYNVDIAPCTVATRGLSIRIVNPPPQPVAGQPVITQSEWAKFDTSKEGTAKLDDLITALDQLNVSIDQKIAAIHALRKGGHLRARVITE